MIAGLIRFSIRYYGVVIAIALLLALYGGYRFATAGLDIFPEFSPKQVIIQTEAPGLATEQVEILVTQQIEFAISGVIGLQSIRSESIQGLSVVTAIFDERSDIFRDRQLINERLAGVAGKLPKNSVPVLVPMSSSSATVLTLGISSEQKDLMALRSLVDWTVVPRLLAVPGVADVNVFGGDIKQLQIQIDPAQLRRFNLGLDEISQALAQAANLQGGGFIENKNQRFTVRISGNPATPEDFENVIVKRDNGINVTLGEIATIEYAPKPAISAAQIMGKPGVVVMVIAQYGANTLSVSKALDAALNGLEPSFRREGIRFYPHLFRPADYIENSIHNLSKHLLVGGFFVLFILYLFLFNTRAALISAMAIPASLLSAVAVLLEAGVNLNIMVLGGLAIALGEVVDDAIIDTENIFRRLRENCLHTHPLPVGEVINRASLEVRSSVVYASFIVALVFVPLLSLDGVAGRLFAPLGYSYILAILLSLLVALTLTPALCHALLGKLLPGDTEPAHILAIKQRYRVMLLWVNRHFKSVLISCLIVCLFGFFTFFRLDHKFLPELREGHYIVHTASIPGTSLSESIRIGSRLTQQFLQIPGVESVSQWAGRAERGADTYGSHYSEYEIRLKPSSGSEQQQILDKLRAILAGFPGISYEANTFLTERIDETIAGYTSALAVNIYGNDLTGLDRLAREIAAIIQKLPGASNVQVRSPAGAPFVQVQLKPDQLKLWGVTPEQVLFSVQTTFETAITGKMAQGNQIYEIALTLPAKDKNNIVLINELPIKTLDNTLIQLDQVAEISAGTGRYNILRQNAQRKQTVTANIVTGDMDGFISLLKERVGQNIFFPAGSYPEYTGAAIEQSIARQKLILHSLFAAAAVMILIYIAVGNLRLLVLTLANLPFALIGGVLAVLLSGGDLSVGSVVGFITLFGITVRNSIMLLSHSRYLIEREGKAWNLETLGLAAEQRLPSILMTALVTALAMLPIALNSDNPGLEIMGPMASIIIGGLFSSTLLNLLLMPCMLLKFVKHKL
jgi:CzcA family heavy metal efflux pump